MIRSPMPPRKTPLKATTIKASGKRMKPSRSTGSPTKAESSRIDTIKRMECMACRHNRITRTRPSTEFDGCDAHHLLSGGKRIGHAATIALCPWHHRAVKPNGFEWMGVGGCIDAFGPSVATGSKPFHETYGSDAELLAAQNALIELMERIK